MWWELKGRNPFLGRERGKMKDNELFNEGFVRRVGVCHLIKEGGTKALPTEWKLCAKKEGWKWGSREILSHNHVGKTLPNSWPTETEIINVCYFQWTCYVAGTKECRIKHHVVCGTNFLLWIVMGMQKIPEEMLQLRRQKETKACACVRMPSWPLRHV